MIYGFISIKLYPSMQEYFFYRNHFFLYVTVPKSIIYTLTVEKFQNKVLLKHTIDREIYVSILMLINI
jgi:hypothetical protein